MVHFAPEDGKPVILFRLCPNQNIWQWRWGEGGDGVRVKIINS